jgi:hypothetical protein
VSDDALPVHIHLPPTGRPQILVDGHDLTDAVWGLRVEHSADPRALPTVLLELVPGAVGVEGLTRVHVADQGGYADAAELVRTIDAEGLFEQLRASNSHRTSPAGMVQLVLDAVAQALDEAT